MSYSLITYLIYLSVSIGLTLIVGRAVFKNGRPFLLEIFRENVALADSVNHLLLLGFCLLNIGYISLNMYSGMEILSVEHMVEKLSYKIGINLLILGGMHVLNLIVLFRLRRRSIDRSQREMPGGAVGHVGGMASAAQL
jgi:hypothetical protein